tara:strand:- start:534 stop:821 length:288 start_codon:yes stop_codon:yes gene_type:complete
MDTSRDEFMMEVQKVHKKLSELVDKYDMKDDYVAIILTGLYNEEEDGSPTIEAVWSYTVDNKRQFNEMIEFIGRSYVHYSDDDEDFDLFGGFNLN